MPDTLDPLSHRSDFADGWCDRSENLHQAHRGPSYEAGWFAADLAIEKITPEVLEDFLQGAGA